MKTLRKSLLVLLIAVFTLAVGLFAAACGNSVKLTFDGNGAQYEQTVTAEKGGSVTLPDAPDRGEEWSFEGWYTNKEGTGTRFTGSPVPEEDTTYYAKWEQLFKLTLDVGSGSIGQTTYWVKSGENILNVLGGATPTASGLTFGAWFDGNTEITSSTRMPSANLTITAKYKVEYTVQVHLQNKTATDFELSATQTVKGSDYVGTDLTVTAPAIQYFRVDANHNGTVSHKTLSANASENVFTFFYTRSECRVAYEANAPQGYEYEGYTENSSALFENDVTIAENGFTIDGARFAGWSTTANGAIAYQPGQTITLNGNTVLYAIWDVSYTDLYGGSDYLFVPQLAPETVILVRDGIEYTGTLDGNVFEVAGLKGQVYAETYFAYYREAGANVTFTQVVITEYNEKTNHAAYLNEGVTIKLDGYGGATFVDAEGTTHSGVYGFDNEEDCYLFRFIGGENAGLGFYFTIGNLSGTDGTVVPAFCMRGSEADEYYEFSQVNEAGSLMPGNYIFVVDGFGGVIAYDFDTGAGVFAANYLIEETDYAYGTNQIFIFHIYYNNRWLVYYNMPLSGGMMAFIAQDGYQGTYANEDGSSLVLDGFGAFPVSATLTLKGAEPVSYSYYAESSVIFGTVVYLYENGETAAVYYINSDGSFAKLEDANYTEFLWVRLNQDTGSASLYYPVVLFYRDSKLGNGFRAEIYAMTENGMVHALTAVCVETDLGGGFITYTLTLSKFAEGYSGNPFLSTGEDFVSATIMANDSSLIIPVYYPIEINGAKMYVEFSGENGEKLWINGFGTGITGLGDIFFAANGKVYEGSTATSYTNIAAFGATMVTFTTYGAEGYEYFYLAIDMTAGTFKVGEFAPYGMYRQTEDGTVSMPAHFYLDGLGNAYYFADAFDYLDNIYVKGTVEEIGKTVFGVTVYRFTAGSTVFTYVVEPYGSSSYIFHKHDGAEIAKAVVYESDFGTFTTDGYHYIASYEKADGTVIKGLYITYDPFMIDGVWQDIFTWFGFGDMFPEYQFAFEYDDVFKMQCEDGTMRLIFVTDDGDFAAWDETYSPFLEVMWMILDANENLIEDATLYVDGLGHAIFMLEDETEIMAFGTYEVIGTTYGYYTIAFSGIDMLNDVEVEYEFIMGLSGGMFALMKNMGTDGVYYNNASALYLDGFGYGYYVNDYGFHYDGYYFTIDEGHIAFISYTGLVFIADVNSVNKTFTVHDNSEYEMTFYAGNFSSAIFTNDRLYVGGATYGYYYGEGNTITLFYFVDEQTFRTMTFDADTEVFENPVDGNSYTRWHEGDIVTVEGYVYVPYQGLYSGYTLTFAPDGNLEFIAPATLSYVDGNGKTQNIEDFYFVYVYYTNYGVSTTLIFATGNYGNFYYDIAFADIAFEDSDEPAEYGFIITASLDGPSNILYYDYVALLGYSDIGVFYLGDYTIGYLTYPLMTEDGSSLWFFGADLFVTDTQGYYLSFEVPFAGGYVYELGEGYYRVLFAGEDGNIYMMDFAFIDDDNLAQYGLYFVIVDTIYLYTEVEMETEVGTYTLVTYQFWATNSLFAQSYYAGVSAGALVNAMLFFEDELVEYESISLTGTTLYFIGEEDVYIVDLDVSGGLIKGAAISFGKLLHLVDGKYSLDIVVEIGEDGEYTPRIMMEFCIDGEEVEKTVSYNEDGSYNFTTAQGTFKIELTVNGNSVEMKITPVA